MVPLLAQSGKYKCKKCKNLQRGMTKNSGSRAGGDGKVGDHIEVAEAVSTPVAKPFDLIA